MSEAKEDPERLALRASPRPVTRLNRKTLVIAATLIAGGILSVTLWSLQPKVPSRNEAAAPRPQGQRVAHAEGLNELPRDYASVPTSPRLGPPLGELGRSVLRAEQDAGIESFSYGESFRQDPYEDAQRADRLRQVQEDEAAAKSQLFFQLSRRPDGSPATETPSASESALDRALRFIPAAQAGEATAASLRSDEAAVQNKQSAKQSFMQRDVDPRIYGSGELQTPRSPYQVMAGTVIPAALVTGINSDLPGQVIATVTQNVYDTVTGRFLLIPQGARLLGQYDSEVTYGQRRVLLVWTRLLLPDGLSMTLDRLPGVDAGGYAGLEDDVNWHWSRIFAGAAMSTLLGAGAELAAPDRSGDEGSIIVAARDSAQETVNEVGQQITRRNLDIQPTLTVRPGFPVNVIVHRDLVLKPFAR